MNSDSKTISQHNNRFNKYLNILISIIEENTDVDSVIIALARKKIKDIHNINPLLVMDTIGAFLLSNDSHIRNNDVQFLLKYKNKDIFMDSFSSNEVNIDDLYAVITTLCSTWGTYPLEEKNKVLKIFKILLSEYSKYLMLTT